LSLCISLPSQGSIFLIIYNGTAQACVQMSTYVCYIAVSTTQSTVAQIMRQRSGLSAWLELIFLLLCGQKACWFLVLFYSAVPSSCFQWGFSARVVGQVGSCNEKPALVTGGTDQTSGGCSLC